MNSFVHLRFNVLGFFMWYCYVSNDI